MTTSNISSDTTEPIVTKIHVEPSGAEVRKTVKMVQVHVTKMMAMPVDRKAFKNLLLWYQWTMALKFDKCIGYVSTAKTIQMVILCLPLPMTRPKMAKC